MRVLHICQRDHPDCGGSLRVAEALVIEQRQAGLDAWLLFLYGPPAEIAQALGPQTICLGLDSSRQAWMGIRMLVKELYRLKPDVIHSHDGITWPRLVFMLVRIPVIMHSHLPANPSINSLRKFLIRFTTDLVVAISEHTKESWEKFGFTSSRIKIVPNGVDRDRFRAVSIREKLELRRRLKLPVDRSIVLWVGRLHEETKGTNRINRFASLMPDGMSVVVVGNGPSREKVERQCQSAIDDGRVILVGASDFPELYYKVADMFLFTSYEEAFGLVILEAIASGLPVISYPVASGGAADLLKEVNAFQLEDNSSAENVQAMVGVVCSERDSYSALSDAVLEKYSWKKQSQEVLSVYRQLPDLGISQDTGEAASKVLVCQHGGRHRYAVPRMLESAGILTALYTDSSSESILGRVSILLGRLAPSFFRRLGNRKIEGIPRQKIKSSDRTYFIDLLQKIRPTTGACIRLYYKKHRLISARMRKWGLMGANVVYSMYHEDLDFIRWAKEQGAQSIVDVFISPLTDDILAEESRILPEWVAGNSAEYDPFKRQLWNETVALADVLICPSEWVADGVRAVSPAAADKIRIVPYGCSIDYQGRRNSPVKGRFLFAGREPLRKGLHYLGQATSVLKDVIPELDVRIAGNIPEHVVKHPICRDLNFLGQLNEAQIKTEFLSADALVLPALSEGFAGVVAEAIGAGCPVIVTNEAGSPVLHEREGLIVPSRDVTSLVAAMQRIVEDRTLRNRCAAECLNQASYFSEEAWKERLVHVVMDVYRGRIR